jgi:hypothetical protein
MTQPFGDLGPYVSSATAMSVRDYYAARGYYASVYSAGGYYYVRIN